MDRVRGVRSCPEPSAIGLGKIAVASCVGFVVGGLGIWLLLRGLWPAPSPLVAETNPAEHPILGEQRKELAVLRTELAELREEVERLSGQLALEVVQSWEMQADAGPLEGSITPEDVAQQSSLRESLRESLLGTTGAPPFNESALTRLGVHPSEAARLYERWEQFEMERLYLTDAAIREGWRMTPRFAREMAATRAALQEELGDEAFDHVLYASGKPNRVVVKSLRDRSPATEAGLEAGDVVVSYDDRRVFRIPELKRMTASGSAGELVSIEILREGRRISLNVPRGPLGVFLRADSLAPEGN